MSDRWATFDCYGTLIDWNGGLWTEFATVWPDADTDRLLELYHHVEPLIEEHGELTYDEVLVRALAATGAIEGLSVPIGREHALAESLPSWPPFSEVPGALEDLRSRGWKLGVLSNTDPELLATSVETIGVPFDVSITAKEAGSYKPASGHWERFFADTGADRGRHVHVGASLFHDIEAASRMGMRAVWINRLDEESEVPRAAELPDLTRLPDTLDEIEPA
jgi:2-haloacid dehalogenase